MRYMQYALKNESIPNWVMEDVLELSKYLLSELGVYMTTVDTYRFWSDVSEKFGAGWLDIDFTIDDCSREDFLLCMLDRYCIEVVPRRR